MFESQHLQTIWFTGLAAHKQRTSLALRPGASHQSVFGREPRPSILRIFATFVGLASAWKRNPRERAEVAPKCCPTPACC